MSETEVNPAVSDVDCNEELEEADIGLEEELVVKSSSPPSEVPEAGELFEE